MLMFLRVSVLRCMFVLFIFQGWEAAVFVLRSLLCAFLLSLYFRVGQQCPSFVLFFNCLFVYILWLGK